MIGDIVATPCGAKGRVFRIIDGFAFVHVQDDKPRAVIRLPLRDCRVLYSAMKKAA